MSGSEKEQPVQSKVSTYLLKRLDLPECGCLDPVSTTDLVLSSRGFQVAQKVVGAEKKVRAMTDGHLSTSWTFSPA